MSSANTVALPVRARARVRVLRRRAVVFLALAALLGAGYMLWFRDSSLVAIKNVDVKGVGRSEDGVRLRRALTAAAEGMTTLHVRRQELAAAARPFPMVRSVEADASFPSGIEIRVVKRRPVALIGDGSVAVAGDGRILRGVELGELELPRLALGEVPKGSWLRGAVRDQARVLGAAPPALLRHVERSFRGPSGVGVELAGGVDLIFAVPLRAEQKWRAAAAVLADPQLGPLDYVDLTVPGRPAVGGVSYAPPPLPAG